MRPTFLKCSDIRNWIRNIEQHASDNVNKILVGNKADMDESKRVSTAYTDVLTCPIPSLKSATFLYIFFCRGGPWNEYIYMGTRVSFCICLNLWVIRKNICFDLQAVPTSKGQELADEYGIPFFETVSYCILMIPLSRGFFVLFDSYVGEWHGFCRVQKPTWMWRKFSSPLGETSSKGFKAPIPSPR